LVQGWIVSGTFFLTVSGRPGLQRRGSRFH
jgi:hypothetical protein